MHQISWGGWKKPCILLLLLLHLFTSCGLSNREMESVKQTVRHKPIYQKLSWRSQELPGSSNDHRHPEHSLKTVWKAPKCAVSPAAAPGRWLFSPFATCSVGETFSCRAARTGSERSPLLTAVFNDPPKALQGFCNQLQRWQTQKRTASSKWQLSAAFRNVHLDFYPALVPL